MDKVLEIKRGHGVAVVRLASGDILRAPSALFLERPLRDGDQVDPEAYRAFIAEKSDGSALAAAMKYLALREHSVREVRDRLRRAAYGEETIDRVVAALEDHGLLSDARLAESWTASRARRYGRNRLAQELRKKGVPEAAARQAIDDIPEEEEYRRAVDQAEKLARKFQGDRQKIAQALIRRGYPWPLARKAAEEAAGQSSSMDP